MLTHQFLPGKTLRHFAVISAMVLLAIFAVAQTTISTGSIVGTVTDPQGAVVAGAQVSVLNAATGQAIALVTNSAGAYSSGPLPPGTYKVEISAAGFRTTTISTGVQVGNTASANARLQVGRADQVVEVTGSSVEINTEQPTVQGVLTSQDIENLPTGSRNFLDLAQLEPGVQNQDGGNFDPTKNGFSSVSFGGRFGRTARIEVDGIDISDETVGTTTQNISAGSISEFQVSQSTLDLSTELTSSGAIGVVTKSGTNAYHGDAFYLFRDKALMANFPGGQDTYYQRNHFGGSFGGAVVKDRLFFFMNGERIKQGQTIPLAPPAPFNNLPSVYPGGFKDTMLLGKLDWNVNSKLTLFYKFNYEWNGDTRAYGSTYQPFANRDQTPSHGVGLNFVSGRFTHSIRFGSMKFQNHIADAVLGNPGVFDPAGNIPVDIRIGPAGVTTRFGPSRLAPQATFQGSHQIKYDGSKLSGSHLFRYGVAFNRIRGGGFASFYGLAPEIRTNNDGAAQSAAATGPFPGGAGNPLNYPVTSMLLGNGQGFFTETPAFGYPAGGQADNRFALYAGDSWKIKPTFTLTYGVRWSRDSGRSDSDLAPLTCDQIDTAVFAPYLPCSGSQRILDQFGGNYGGRVNQPNHNFGPQLGFAWNLHGNGKTVIRGGTGIYYENAVFNNILFDRPGRLPKGLFFGTESPCTSGAITLPSGNVTTVNGRSITSICSDIVGNVLQDAAAMQAIFQQGTAAAGATTNPNFLGENLANGPNSTGNNFVAPNYKTPYSIQMNLGLQHEIRPGMVVTADFLRNVGLHYLLAYDTNHVGDARYLNVNSANAAIAATLAQCGVSTIQMSYSGPCPSGNFLDPNTNLPRPANIGDYAANGLDGGKNYLSGFPASDFGLTPDTGAAFPGINPLVGENEMLFPVGRSVYTGLQIKLVQRVNNLVGGLKNGSFQVSYALSRFNSMTGDQDFVNSTFDFRNPTHYFGPSSLDRTHQLSFGGSFELPHHGPRLSFASHFFSPLANNLAASFQFRAGEGFFSDYLGDGAAAPHILPGQQLGSWGRDVKASNINSVIGKYNSNVAGSILPMGQALIGAKLFTQAELQSLGAVADQIDPAPSDEMNMTWLKTFDLKASWPIRLREGILLEPSIGFYNLFNFANFNAPGNTIGGAFGEITGCQFGTVGGCGGTPGGANGTPLSDRSITNSLRTGTGSGANTTGAPRQIDFGLKLTF